jgi:hypothetical protein
LVSYFAITLVLLSIPNNQLEGVESLQVSIDSVIGQDGKVKEVKDSLTIGISKSETRYNYPLHYQQDFNYRPYESYVKSNMFSCNDDLYDDDPDWGWVTDSNQERIDNSQGFWCSCNALDLIGIRDSFKRATSWATFQFFSGSASAHWLRFDDVYYHAYEVKEPILDYRIDVGFIKRTIDELTQNEVVTQDYVTVSPYSAIANSEPMETIVKIVGDFQESEAIPDLTGRVLLKVSK